MGGSALEASQPWVEDLMTAIYRLLWRL